MIKTKKRKKSPKQMGSRTHGHGAMKRGSGHRGGFGMAGTGKRADQKKSLIIAKYGNKYFGKQGITSKGTKKRKLLKINLREIMDKFSDKTILDLKKYKILGDGEISKAMTITAYAFTTSAKEKIEKAGGKAITPERKIKPETIVKSKSDNTQKDSSEEQKPSGKTDISTENKIEDSDDKKEVKEEK